MDVGESNRLVTILTRNNGVIKAFAHGVKSIKSKRAGATGILSYSNFTLQKKNDTYTVTEAVPIKVFFSAGSDIEILSLAQYFCELCFVFAPQEAECEEFLRLILNSLHFLSEKKLPALQVKAITEFKVMAISGYMPDLIACTECGKFEETDDFMYFGIDDGSLMCSKCQKGKFCFKIDQNVLKALRHIVYSPFNNLYSFSVSSDTAKKLSDITEKYLVFQSEHNFSTLNFYHSLKNI